MSRILYALGIFIFFGIGQFSLNAYSTFFSPVSINSYEFYSIYPELFSSDKKVFFLSPFLQVSFKNSSLAQQFTVNEFDNFVLDQQGLGDINPLWFNLGNFEKNYTSTVKFSPQFIRAGSGFHIHANFLKAFLQIDGAVLSMITNMRVQEFNSPENGILPTTTLLQNETIQNAIAAFTNPDMQYGKITGPLHESGMENIQCRLGAFHEHRMHSVTITTAPYLQCSLPTGKKPDAQYLFAPQVGNNHFGIGAGITTIFEGNSYKLLFDTVVQYNAKALEMRSFDLAANGKWSRYLLVFRDGYSDEVPGINIFTQPTLITPQAQFLIFARYDKKVYNSTWFFTYSFFGHMREKILSVQDIQGQYGIFPLGAPPTPLFPQTASTARINQSASGSGFDQVSFDQPAGTFVGLTTADLDISSGRASSWITNTISAGWKYIGVHAVAEFAGALELPWDNKGAFTWSIWAVVGYSF